MADNPGADELLYDPVQIHANKSSWCDSWNPGELVRRHKSFVLLITGLDQQSVNCVSFL